MESLLFATKKKDTVSQQMTKRVIKPKEYASGNTICSGIINFILNIKNSIDI